MKNLSILFFALVLVTFSCKKEQPNIPDTVTTYPNYTQLKVGNYWVYERFEVDTIGNETPLGIIDTCRIEKDTIINGKTYYKYVRAPYFSLPTTTFVRDSLHYLVDNTGRIIFSSQVFDEIFRVYLDTLGGYELHEWMTDKNKNVLTPNDNFTTNTFQMIYYYAQALQEFGNPRQLNFRYAENIGIVSETIPWIFTNPNYLERRLVDYHIE